MQTYGQWIASIQMASSVMSVLKHVQMAPHLNANDEIRYDDVEEDDEDNTSDERN
jgi:hypothetical protein